MSTGHYHRRWSAGSSASRSTPISSSLTSNVEPSTYGTSWNSVRWNKPNTGTGYRSLSTLASQFEPRTLSKSHYSPSPIGRSSKPSSRYDIAMSNAARHAANIASLGPSVSVRASRFDSTVRDQKDKYRTEARDLINKWTSRERGSASTAEPSYSSRKLDAPTTSPSTSYPYRTSTITPRAHSTSVSRYSSYERPTNSSYTSPSPTPQTHTLKAERPWRQRMAESQRIRATLGDEVSPRSREGTSIYGPNSRFTSSFASHSGYKPKEDNLSSKYMSRSYSPIRSSSDIFKNPSSSRIAAQNSSLDRQSSLESVSNRDEAARDKGVSVIPKTASIRESSKEKDNERKRFSSKERTARRNSRQQSLNLETSSSDEDIQSKEETRKLRRKKSKHNLPGGAAKTLPNNENIKLEPGDTVSELTNQLVGLANKDEQLASCPSTPRATRKFSKQNSLSRVPSKTQIIKSPSVVEVPGISRSESISSIKSPSFKTAPSEDDKKKILVGSNSLDNIDDLTFDSCEDTQDDESQYSAIAHFKPFKPVVKRLAPVPGLWNMSGGEENISINKSFERLEAVASTSNVIEVKAKDASSKKIKALPSTKKSAKAETNLGKATDDSDTKVKKVLPKKVLKVRETSAPKPSKDENVALSKVFVKRSSSASDVKTLIERPRRTVALPKVRSAPTLREIGCEKVFKKKSISSDIAKTLKTAHKNVAKLTCKQPKTCNVKMEDEISRKERSSGAQVIVDTPQKGVNISKIKKRIKLQRKELLEPTATQKECRSLDHPLVTAEDVRRSSSRAAEFLDEMRYTEPRMDWNRDDLESSGILILPDKSILEEYVRRKRGRLERLHSEPIQERDESSDRGSPCPSTKSELLPACTARVFNPSSYGHSYITTPSRNHSIEPSSASATPTIPGSVMLLDSIQPASNYNNFNSTPQAFLRANTARIQCARPIQFEAPKSAFEERMQMQANAIRKASINSATSDDYKQIGEPTRRGSDSMNSISSAFEAALAEKQQGVGRHERYAAHIPVLRGDGSGRQSAASVDSSQSGVLETASKQLDQVIDQARHRHHQHRSKFKEAIDYLDQIFEDLKKECEPTEEVSAKPSKPTNVSTTAQPLSSSLSTKKENISVKKPSAIQSAGQSSGNSSKTNSLPTRGNKNKLLKPPSPLDVVIAAGITSSNSLKPSKPSKDSSEPPTEYAVTETIVLPKKTDKLDFTRRWLHNDLSSLAHNVPVNLISDSGTYLDEDEHSLGSCSAEVAAINVDKIKKPTKQPQIVLPPNQPVPIRPQPFRPQPGFVGTPGSSNGTRHFPVDYDNQHTHFTGSSSLQRVASFDHMTPDKRASESHYWRSGSQEPYHTLQSVRSDADCRPSPSAFQALGNRGSSLRASLRSLPDASIVRANSVSRREQQQPPLSIDQLVADLELNTEAQFLANDKRRSFPTTLEAEVNSISRNNSHKERTTGAGVRTSYHAPPAAQVKSNVTTRNYNLNHKSLDEVTSLLNNVVGDMNNGNVQLRRKQTNVANGSQLNPFETINQEKINPSRVEAMHNMFERGGSSSKSRSGNVNANSAWRAGPQPFRRMVQQPSSINNLNNNNNNNIKLPFEEESYYDIADFAVKPYRKVSPPRQVLQTTSTRKVSPSIDSNTPAYPSSQPPQFPPSSNSIRNGSATSSTNGGYYSSNSSMAGGNQMTRRSSLVGHQSISSRAPSIDDEDDGFYDNIGVYDDRRFSHGSDMDVASISSRPPGNAKGTRIGSFLRKIGGRTSRPPGSAASLISLNKVANDTHMHQGILQKSNSMSSEPWNKQILQANGKSQTTSASSSIGAKSERGSSNGIGTRLKNSLFGSKKRLNG